MQDVERGQEPLGEDFELPQPEANVEAAAEDLAAEMLEDEGWQVAEVEDGRQAMEATARFVPDLIVLDLMMPVMDGGQFLAWLRQQPALREVPVWVVSAKDLDLAELDALRSQANEIIPKGASMQEELRQALRQLT